MNDINEKFDNTDNDAVTVRTEVQTILDWPTDSFAIDYVGTANNNESSSLGTTIPPVHSVLVFIPGNPGLIDWYIPFFSQILKRLGPGFACRGIALAGHSLDHQQANVERYKDGHLRDTAIAWTVDGQVQHKCAYMDVLMDEFDKNLHVHDEKPRFVFVSHSIGAHFTQRLCTLRPDILQRTRLLIHLMPFIRMDAPVHMQFFLNTCARAPETTISIFNALVATPLSAMTCAMLDKLLSWAMNDDRGRDIAVRLLQMPTFARNFGTLGLEEVRDVPQVFDISAMRFIGQRFGVPTDLLYAGNDHWAPAFHMKQLAELQALKVVPGRAKISITYKPELQHDFVSRSEQVPLVMEYCVSRVQRVILAKTNVNNDACSGKSQPLRSRL